ncbi:MAG: tetrahydrofolate dehydrogenase/cyclohydrolase catalytic domain-containing protein, partial [Chloroflexota bacterium]
MPATVIDGRALASQIHEELKERIAALGGVVPGLAAVVVGEEPASASYLRGIARGCEKVGLIHEVRALPQDADQATLE